MTTPLTPFFLENQKIVLAFSGGTDSAYLLWAALNAGCYCQPVFLKSALQPAFEEEDAQQLCHQLGVDLVILQHDIWDNQDICANSARRCYYCKKALFTTLIDWAQCHGFPLIIDGTNSSDNVNDRPGFQALRELGVRSPLREAGLTKEMIRQASKEAGLFTWDKPAYACLATRVATDSQLTPDKLHCIETGEAFLHSLGFRDFRLRLLCDGAKLEITAADWPLLGQYRELIFSQLQPQFKQVYFDLKVRHGD